MPHSARLARLEMFVPLLAALLVAGWAQPAAAAPDSPQADAAARSGALATSGTARSAAAQATTAVPAGAAFTYQGVLNAGGTPLNGTCDLQFSLWDDATAGTQVGATQTVTTTVSAGLVNAVLNDAGQFGPTALDGRALWLGISVRAPSGSGAYTALAPRQAITPAPLASGLRSRSTLNSTNSSAYTDGGAFVIYSPGAPGVNGLGLESHAGGASWLATSWFVPVGVWGDSHSGQGIAGTSYDRTGVYGYSASGHGVEGECDHGGYAGYFRDRVYLGGNLESPRFRTTMVINSLGPLPLTSGAFTTGGGTLVLNYSGSGYLPALPAKTIGMTVKIDGTFVDNTGIFANQSGMHLAFVSKSWILPGIAAGTHTIELSGFNGVATDVGDIFNVSVTELPF